MRKDIEWQNGVHMALTSSHFAIMAVAVVVVVMVAAGCVCVCNSLYFLLCFVLFMLLHIIMESHSFVAP